jgi:hypothetical protein
VSKLASVALLMTVMGIQGSCLAADPAPNWTKQDQTQAPISNPPQARIVFARRGGIYNWTIPDDKTVFIEDLHHQWYRADLMGNFCIGLHFALRVGFTFEPNGDFDKFNSILYERQTCPLKSLVMVDPPKGFKGKIGTPGAVPPTFSVAASTDEKVAQAKDGAAK